MTPEDRISVIKECIEYLKGRPGRNAILSLKGMLVAEAPKTCTKPAENHPQQKELNV